MILWRPFFQTTPLSLAQHLDLSVRLLDFGVLHEASYHISHYGAWELLHFLGLVSGCDGEFWLLTYSEIYFFKFVNHEVYFLEGETQIKYFCRTGERLKIFFTFLFKIELLHFLLPLPASRASHFLAPSQINNYNYCFHTYIHICVYVWMCISMHKLSTTCWVCVCVCTRIHACICMISWMIVLYWIASQGFMPGRRQLSLSQ